MPVGDLSDMSRRLHDRLDMVWCFPRVIASSQASSGGDEALALAFGQVECLCMGTKIVAECFMTD